MKTIYLSIFLGLVAILPLQAQYLAGSYEEFATPSYDYYYKPFLEQQDIFNLYVPSTVTLNNSILSFVDIDGDGNDDYVTTDYDTSAGLSGVLKMPIGNGLIVLIMCLSGYAIFRRMKPYKF
jgi:hypothetical protein